MIVQSVKVTKELRKDISEMVVSLIERIYALLWGDLIHVPLPGGDSVGISLLIILLIPTGIYFTVRTKVLPLRLFPDMNSGTDVKEGE